MQFCVVMSAAVMGQLVGFGSFSFSLMCGALLFLAWVYLLRWEGLLGQLRLRFQGLWSEQWTSHRVDYEIKACLKSRRSGLLGSCLGPVASKPGERFLEASASFGLSWALGCFLGRRWRYGLLIAFFFPVPVWACLAPMGLATGPSCSGLWSFDSRPAAQLSGVFVGFFSGRCLTVLAGFGGLLQPFVFWFGLGFKV
ncbi:hypothetical protein OIU74_017345 [Salix koriyanagi]|uniref:Uncharacterized protein n=1 Tax=Salix koriyanagi TaxID=2511006 RepID=A0A9Q0WPW6_9ROSI|nr:hypothetical protein OIU74_017345 [Salix koriyanagi]